MKRFGPTFALLALGFVACVGQPERAEDSDLSKPGPDIVSAQEWKSSPQPIPEARKHVPVRITIHHAGVLWAEGSDPYTKILALQTWGKRDKQWPDVPYHYLIAPDGRIFEGRDWHYEGETNTEYDTRGHLLVQLWGDFDKQKVTEEQLDSAVRLVAWLCAEHGISPSTIRGHKDWSTQTSCPGTDLYGYLENGEFVTRVQQVQR